MIHNGVHVQLSLTMLQESELKRLVFGLQIDYHFVDYIECYYSINIEVLYPALDREIAFRGRSELANWISGIRASRDWAIDCNMSRVATVEA